MGARSPLVLSLMLAPALAFAVPPQFAHQGRLLDAAGGPIDGSQTVTFRLRRVNASRS